MVTMMGGELKGKKERTLGRVASERLLPPLDGVLRCYWSKLAC